MDRSPAWEAGFRYGFHGLPVYGSAPANPSAEWLDGFDEGEEERFRREGARSELNDQDDFPK